MRTRTVSLILLIAAFCGQRVEAFTIRAPLIGHVVPPGPAIYWLSETRIWNPNASPATVTISDVIGAGAPPRRSFTVPPRGLLNLRTFDLFYDVFPPPSFFPPLLALVEFMSDLPIEVYTTINARAPISVGPSIPSPWFPHFGGDPDRPLAGPMLRGFEEYVQPGAEVGLGWLTMDTVAYRNNLFFTNPTAETLTVTATYHSSDGASSVTKSYVVAPRSQSIIANALNDPAVSGNLPVGAVTATFIGDRPFYVFAAVISEHLACQQQPLYTLVQPEQIR